VTLNSRVQVDLPKKGVIVRHIGNSHPVYRTVRSYRNSHGTPTSERVVIGKLDLDSGKLIPNARYWDYYGQTGHDRFVPSFESVRQIGGAFLIGQTMSRLGLVDLLDQSFGVERSKLIRTASLYMATRGNVFDGIDDYCATNILFETPLGSQTSSQLFASITHDERMSFFKSWIDKQDPGAYLAYDVSSFSTYAKDIINGEYGHNRDGERLPQINLGCFVSESSELPIFYVTYPGSIVDKSHLPYMMAYNNELGIYNIGFVLDRGFCSTANIQYLAISRYKFIIGVEKSHKTTKMAIDFFKPCIVDPANRIESCVFAMSSSGNHYGTRSTMHVYHDRSLADNQLDALFKELDKDENYLSQKKCLTREEVKKYRKRFSIELASDGTFTFERDMDKIRELSSYFGFFCLLTNTPLDSTQVLEKYRRKDVIEKNFDDLKNYIYMKRLRTHTDDTTNGKIFCAFISLIIASEIGVRLRKFMEQKALSKAGLIREMDKICVGVKNNDPRLLNPLTKTQRMIIKELGLNEDDLRDYVGGR
jgi:transposase